MSAKPPLLRLKFHGLLALLAWSMPLSAWAQSGPPTSSAALTAESAFLDGLRLMKQGDCSHAVPRFQESQRLDPASGTLLNLAYCQNQLGKTASAWLSYRQAAALAERTGKPAHAQLAREQGDKLEAALPKLSFALVGDANRVTQLRLDDEELLKASWSLSIPVDPGSHQVVAVFDTGESWTTTLLAQPGQASVVEVKVPDAAVASAPIVASTQLAAGGDEATQPHAPAPRAPAPSSAESQHASAWTLGLGLAGAGAVLAGGALFVSARLGYDAARDHCSSDNACPSPYYAREQSAQNRAKWSFVMASSGALLVGAAVVVHFRTSHDDKPPAVLSAALLGAHGFGAAYTGAF